MIRYALVMAIGTLLCFGLYALLLQRQGEKPLTALAALPLGAAYGFLLAKVGYTLLLAGTEFARYGVEALWRLRFDALSFVCGAAGVCLGVAIAARLTGTRVRRALDVFVPAGALLVALFRAGEMWLGSLGGGTLLDASSPYARFPFAVEVPLYAGYTAWTWAVCLLEALMALLCAAAMFFVGKRLQLTMGLTFELGAFFLAMPQVFCESLRAKGMRWGFVRPEQVLCGVILLALVTYGCRHMGGSPTRRRRYLPALGVIGCVLLVVGVEFALDKSDLPNWACYAVMWAALLGMAAMELDTVRRREKE